MRLLCYGAFDMAAAALTFREALEVWLVVMVVASIGGSVRHRVRSALTAIGGAMVLGGAIGAGAGVIGAGLDVRAKAAFQAALLGLGALLMVWAVLRDPPYVRLERVLAAGPKRGDVGGAPVVFRALVPVSILAAVLLYDCVVGTWGAADLLGGMLGSAMGVVVGLLGAAAMVSLERLEPRRGSVLLATMVFIFVGYLVAYDLGAFPQAGLIPSPHVSPDRGVSAIATVLGISSVALLARLARRRGQLQPRPFLALINPLFIGFAAYFAFTAIQQLALWYVIAFPEEVSWGVLVAATILTAVVFVRSRAVLSPRQALRGFASDMDDLTRMKLVRRGRVLLRRRTSPLRGEESAGG